ncbi:unnamed protein product, partial [Ixodes hexagonus]
MAVADSNYRFVLVDVGAYGRQSDGGVLKQSLMGASLEHGPLDLPGTRLQPGTSTPAMPVFLGDEAFQLRPDFLRPCPGKSNSDDKVIFNCRLSRARHHCNCMLIHRRCVENAFGILCSRWRLFRRPLGEEPERAELLVAAACALHNFLTQDSAPAEQFYCPPSYADRII